MARKEDKLRPYRVDYFDIDEMKENDLALVRSVIVRAVTSAEAIYSDQIAQQGRIIIRAYRYYKNLVHKKDVYKPVEDLFTANKALKIMEAVELYRAKKVVPDHAVPDPAYGVTNATFYKNNAGTQVAPPSSGPDSPATVAVVADLQGMIAHDKHEQIMDTFVPDSVPEGKRFPDLSNKPIDEALEAYDNVFPEPEPLIEPGKAVNSPMPGVPSANPFVVSPNEPYSLKWLAVSVITLLVLGGIIYLLRH